MICFIYCLVFALRCHHHSYRMNNLYSDVESFGLSVYVESVTFIVTHTV